MRKSKFVDRAKDGGSIVLALVASLAIALVPGPASAAAGETATYDLIIRSGSIIDGSGAPARVGDIAVSDGRIVAIGDLSSAAAERTIDASRLTVAPGFIDMHTHSDVSVLEDGAAHSMVRQGVTLNLIGEGNSVAPNGGKLDPDPARPWTGFTGYFDALREKGVSINMASFVASEQVRRVVMGYDPRAATAAELEQMKALVARSMEEGAMGLIGRFDTGGPAHPGDIIELAKVASLYGGIYATHTGRQGSQQEKEYAFAIRVAEEAGIPVHIYHMKIIGEDNWGTLSKNLDQVEQARARGLEVNGNQYPYTAMSHGWNAFFPVWTQERGPAQFAAYLKDPDMQKRIRADAEYALLSTEHGGWGGIVLGSAQGPASQYAGMLLTDIAAMRGDADPGMTAIALMAEESGRITGVFHNQSESDLQLAMKKPWISVASDGAAVNLVDPANPHPRAYGSNVRVLGHYVRELKLITLEEAVRKMTSLPASFLGLKDRGLLKVGYAADIVLFDAKTVADTATFEAPASYPVGVPYVIVNGVPVIDRGEHTGARPGQPILGPGAPESTQN